VDRVAFAAAAERRPVALSASVFVSVSPALRTGIDRQKHHQERGNQQQRA
jgi:hypothetical protein